MNLRFEYNKTSLQNLYKQLKIRQSALPTLKNKESALRVEVKRAHREAEHIAAEIESIIEEQGDGIKIWCEYDDSLLKVNQVKLNYRKIAGVRVPVLDDVQFATASYNLFSSPKWYPDGIELLKLLVRLKTEQRILMQKVDILEYVRKKTTQKVNLFEKVQIPAYENAVRKIKRFLEDEENLMKAAQKIVKRRQQKELEEA